MDIRELLNGGGTPLKLKPSAENAQLSAAAPKEQVAGQVVYGKENVAPIGVSATRKTVIEAPNPTVLPRSLGLTGLPFKAPSKRSAEEAALEEAADLGPDDDWQHIVEDLPMDSCNSVRNKIRKLIDSGEYKIGEFCKEIGVSNKSYNSFLAQNGPYKGLNNSTYQNAWEFFKKRELIKKRDAMKVPKKRKSAESSTVVSAPASASTPVAGSALPELAEIILPKQGADQAEVYDACDDIRRKINAYFQKPSVTQAQFLRDIAAQFHVKERKIQPKQLSDFRSEKGELVGCTSTVFYGSYVLFEKVRLKEGKPKSAARLKCEEHWVEFGGIDLTDASANRGVGYYF